MKFSKTLIDYVQTISLSNVFPTLYKFMHTGIMKKITFLMIKATFHLVDVIKHFFQSGSAAKNEVNANQS